MELKICNFLSTLFWNKDFILQEIPTSVREYWHIFVFVSFLHTAVKNWCFCLNSPSYYREKT